MQQEIKIEEMSTQYDITAKYHSDLMCQNYDAKILGVSEGDNRISIYPNGCCQGFEFVHSDPDLVIAIANMILSFAQMVKKENQKAIDISNNA